MFARSHLCLHKGRRVYKKKRCRKARRLRLIWWESPAASEGIVFATGKRLIPSSPPRRAVHNVQPFPFTRRWDLRALHTAPWYAANPCPACWTARNPLTFFCCSYLARAYSVDARFRFVSPYKSHLLRQKHPYEHRTGASYVPPRFCDICNKIRRFLFVLGSKITALAPYTNFLPHIVFVHNPTCLRHRGIRTPIYFCIYKSNRVYFYVSFRD